MFFDDYPRATENQLFIYTLTKALGSTDIEVLEEKTISYLEASLRVHDCVAIILDVMSAFPEAPEHEALAGIEILRRCRAGSYGVFNSRTLIYMRTARGELHVKELAFTRGCTDYFTAGSQDDKLLDILVKRLG